MKRPLLKIYTLSYSEIEKRVYRRLVKWGWVKLPVTMEFAKDQRKAKQQADNMTLLLKSPIDFHHVDRFGEIAGHILVRNTNFYEVVLEGTVLRRLVLPANSEKRVNSPIYELVPDGHGKMMRREWDALEVVTDMIAQMVIAKSFIGLPALSRDKLLEIAAVDHKISCRR